MKPKKRSDNTSGVTGVYYLKTSKKWRVFINTSGKQVFLGVFSNFAEAVERRRQAEIEQGYYSPHGSAAYQYLQELRSK
ncbi:MAG: hypothetical protein DRJ03_03355 [Chloroflexi bacterium]|nr:MAG: hypothetical protein DRJ03_03355 [Chloroflexota bacterium]